MDLNAREAVRLLLFLAVLVPRPILGQTVAEVANLARVRISLHAPIGESGESDWFVGTVTGRCANVVVRPEARPAGGSAGVGVAGLRTALPQGFLLRGLARMQVSSVYHGRFVPGGPSTVYSRGAPLDDEEWLDVDLSAFIRLLPVDCL
jgi:hypothetical protein